MADGSEHLNKQEKGIPHKMVLQMSFACERGGTDMGTTASVLCGGVKEPGRNDWNKSVQLMKFLHDTQDDALRSSVGLGSVQSEWFVDALFSMHPNHRENTGAAFGFKHGRGFPVHVSGKQKLNTSGSATCKLVGVDDVSPKILWTPLFLKGQGHKTVSDEVHQDNTLAVLFKENGRKSAGKRM